MGHQGTESGDLGALGHVVLVVAKVKAGLNDYVIIHLQTFMGKNVKG